MSCIRSDRGSGAGQQGGALPHYVIKSWATGAALGVLFAAVLLGTDTAGLLTLLKDSADPGPAIALLVIGFGSTIGGLYILALLVWGGRPLSSLQPTSWRCWHSRSSWL